MPKGRKRKREHRLLGVHEVRMKLASGEAKVYRYAWRGGPRLHHDPDSHEYLLEFAKATRDRPVSTEGLINGLIYVYRQSGAYTKLSADTKRSYDAALDMINAEFGHIPVSDIEARGSRATFLDWRDEFKDTPRKADLLITVMARVFSIAKDRELITRNPLERVEKLSDGTRRDAIWYPDQVAQFKAHASPSLCMAMDLARWTGQRQADLLTLPWSAYDGTHIRLIQGKTKRRVRIKVYDELKVVLDGAKKKGPMILTTERGERPWTSDGFRASWGKACTRAKIEGLTFHDLRGTFITLAYQQGASIKDIAEVSGHSERDAEAIIKRHYLAGDKAVEMLERRNGNGRKL